MKSLTAWGTVAELAADAGLTVEVAQDWVRRGGAPGTIKTNSGFLMPREHWEELVASLRRHPAS